jgi:hypothetical protein
MRVIQYPRDVSDEIERLRRTGYPHARGMTAKCWAQLGPRRFDDYLGSLKIESERLGEP